MMSKNNYKNAIRSYKEVNQVLLLPLAYAVAISILYFSSNCPFEEARWPFYYGLTFSFARNMILMQISFVTKQSYNPLNIGTMRLDQGLDEMTLQATSMPGTEVMDVRLLLFEKVSQ